jgi:hypothetical protein
VCDVPALSTSPLESSSARLAEVVAALDAERARSADLESQLSAAQQAHARLRASYEALRVELELLKRRLFVAKAERVDTKQLELDYGEVLKQLDELGAKMAAAADTPDAQAAGLSSSNDDDEKPKPRPKPKGRRDLKLLPIEEVRVELPDPAMEDRVAAGEYVRGGFEESSRLLWQRGGPRRFVTARIKYVRRAPTPLPAPADEATTSTTPTDSGPSMRDPKLPEVTQTPEGPVFTAAMPTMTFPRSLAMPSLLAHIIVEKFCDGLPLFRVEDRFRRDGVAIDRGTMCRWLEDAGGTLGASVVAAMRKDALSTAFCIATDATGVAVQPPRTLSNMRKPCKKGHFLILIADADHVFFDYLEKETSKAIDDLFKGFTGYVQADAKSVFDLLYLSPAERRRRNPPDDDEAPDESVRIEVGCWSHARRKFWEAAVSKSAAGREGLARIGKIFALERQWRGKPPEEIRALRERFSRPHVEAFFAWAAATYAGVRAERGYLRTAVGYATRQREALSRFLDDGRLVMDNNRSERGLRRVAVGRKAWLFFGSDDHAESAGNLFSLIASCRLHGLNPETYLRDVICVLAQWPKDRYLELAPKYWARTRALLDDSQLANEVAWFTIPPPLVTAMAEQQAPTG